MKNCKYFIFITALVALASCQKLDRDFNTILSKEKLEQSMGSVSSLLTGIYADLPDGLLYISNSAMLASATDDAEFTSETNPVQAFNTGSWNAINNPDYVWDRYYRSIRKTNQFLLSTGNIILDQYKLDPAPGAQAVYQTNLATIKRWSYEARLLRAFFYFELVKRYGGVPLINTALSVTDDFSQTKRNTLNECLEYIKSECDSAAPQLPLKADNYTTPNADLGRVTRLTAFALKSRVLLYAASDLWNMPAAWAGGYANPELISLPATTSRADRWKAASDAAKMVIDSGGTINLMVNSYGAVFNAYNTLNQTGGTPEIIFTRSVGAANTYERNNAPIGYPNAIQGNANTPSQDLVDAYDVIVSPGVVGKFDWNNPAMAANPYANRDPRLATTVIVNNSTFGTTTSPRVNTVQLFTGGQDAKPLLNASKTGYYLRKYQINSLNLGMNNTQVHSWILFRFPEIWLNYAEALNEWSPGNADIKIYYDKIRARANMPLLPAGLSQSATRDKIRNERRVELAFEDHRSWDVRRWMIGPATLGAPLRGVDITRTSLTPLAFTYVPFKVEDRDFQPKHYLYPIPQVEINISPKIVQNPLW